MTIGHIGRTAIPTLGLGTFRMAPGEARDFLGGEPHGRIVSPEGLAPDWD